MTLKLAQFCDDPKKISTKSSYPPKILIVLKTPKNIEIRNFEPPKIARAYSQGARFLKIDLAQLCSQKRFDFGNSSDHPSTTFLGTSYSQIVVAVFKEESFCTPTPFLL